MEYKHFSHKHSLILHHVPQGSEITCSGCNFPGTGSIYVCWECRHFLHEQCFNATRAMNHPSHPPHPLTLVPYPTYPSNSIYCNSCNQIGTGFSYSCSTCEFDMHIHCAYMHNNTTHQPHNNHNHSQHHMFPNQNPGSTPQFHQVVQTPSPPLGYPVNNYPSIPNQNHGSNPHYSEQVTQTTTPPAGYPSAYAPNKLDPTKTQGIMHFSHSDPLLICTIEEDDPVVCTCCEIQISGGSAYSCTKLNCNFYLHKSCFDLQSEIRHKSHPKHPLKLLARSPYKNGEFACNACYRNGKGFTYHCLVCGYDLHVDCASSPENVKRNDHAHPLRLLYTNPIKHLNIQQEGVTFSCDVCNEVVHESCWTYLCQDCDYGTHVECINSVAKQGGGGGGRGGQSSDNSVLDMYLKIQKMQSEIQKASHQAMLDSV